MGKVLLYDSSHKVKARVKGIIDKLDHVVDEVDSTGQLLSKLAEPEDYVLIILDVVIKDEDGFALVKRVHDMFHGIPIVILTSENSRSSFVKGIQMGASDYILKPFENSFLEQRLVSQLNQNRHQQAMSVKEKSLDLHDYLTKEIAIGKKARFEVSLCMTLFYKPVQAITPAVEREYQTVSSALYDKFKEAVFDQDIFVPYGSQSYITILPMCSSENRNLVSEKFERVFNFEKTQNKSLQAYELVNVFVTFPIDGQSKDEIMDVLLSKTKTAMQKNKITSNDL